MDINRFRQLIFLNSQYCNYYNEGDSTVIAGVLRDCGYKYSVKLPKPKLDEINKIYRKFTTVMNVTVAAEIILYVYFIIFPYFVDLMKLPFFISVMLMAFIPLIMLFFTYLAVNYLYENYLQRYVGTYKKIKFKPTIYNIDRNAYQNYKKEARKSVFVLAVMIFLFVSYVTTPFFIDSLINTKNYKSAYNLSNIYLKFVPISAEVYALRGYAEYKLKNYRNSINDFEKANKYSLSNTFDKHILGLKTYIFNYEDMINEFDKFINGEKEKPVKYLIKSEKAAYRLKNADYNKAYEELNELVKAYEKREKAFFDPANVYFNRAYAGSKIGAYIYVNTDKEIAKNICPECKFNFESTLIQRP